jgi:hypothetical protein
MGEDGGEVMWCTCGHTDEEHFDEERALKFPGSSACTIEGCDCICFEGVSWFEYHDEEGDDPTEDSE